MLEPLLNDPRLQRTADGWRLVARTSHNEDDELRQLCVTALAIAATGPRPTRHRLLGLAALHVEGGQVVARFASTFKPGARVPRYVAERARLGHEILDDLPTFEAAAEDLLAFLGERPILAQEARTTWAFLEHELRRAGRTPRAPALIDVNRLADLVLDLRAKPSLPGLAQHFGVGVVHVGQPEDEARVLADVGTRLLAQADAVGLRTLRALEVALGSDGPLAAEPPLRRASTASDLPDAPGVYRLRDAHEQVLYVGKARRLRQRLHDYVHRPLGATRRLEGLVDAVSDVDATLCGSDLQALILEDREIRRLQPRYNTQRRLHPPRVWLRRDRRGIRLCEAPPPGEEVLGPFRNQQAAEAARHLATRLFRSDADLAWRFLVAPELVRSLALTAARSQRSLVAAVVAYVPDALLLPADPAQARFAVVRPAPELEAAEVFVLERGVLIAQGRVPPADVPSLLASSAALTDEAERHVVLRWLGAQRPPARLVHLPTSDDLEPLVQAVSEVLAARDP